MEQNPPVFAKKAWRLMRVVYLMLRKGILKRKLLLDLNMMIKRKLSHHHNNRRSHDSHHLSFASSPPPGEYEFSCSNTPSNSTNNNNPLLSLFSFHNKKHHHSTGIQHADQEDRDMTEINAAVLMKAMEMIHSESMESPVMMPGFGKSSIPMVRQIRVTDSPFPLSGVDEDSHRVDEAAERFIRRFYDDLRRQDGKGAFGSG